MPERAITVENLNKTFGSFKAVDGLSFHVEQAECFGLLGPNGAGKTTSMKMLYGKAVPDSTPGTVLDLFGYRPGKEDLAIKSFSAIVPQQDNLDLELNVTDNLRIYSKFYGLPKAVAEERIKNLLAFMELQEKAHANVRQLSGGMQRRLTIARALLNNPRILILDEPTTGLDPQVRHLIWNKLRELKEQGVTILLTTHYMEEAFQICDRLIVMDKGRKILEGAPRTLLKENLERFVMEVYGAQNGGSGILKAVARTGLRHEIHRDTLFVFSPGQEALTQLGESLHETDFYIRHSNLEDLFLKVTGRSLNELQ